MTRAFCSKLVGVSIAAFALAAMSTAAIAAPLRVPLDHARPLALKQSAAGVVVGNPAIAGVSLQNDKLLFVTGRSYGTTNLIVVGDNGRTVYSGTITVVANENDGIVTVTKGAATVRQSCTPICRTTPDISDDPAAFEMISKQVSDHAGSASGGK